MPEILDSIHYISGELRSIIDVRPKYYGREYAVNLFDCGVLDARIIYADLDAAKDRALEHLAKYGEMDLTEDIGLVFRNGKLYVDSVDFELTDGKVPENE